MIRQKPTKLHQETRYVFSFTFPNISRLFNKTLTTDFVPSGMTKNDYNIMQTTVQCKLLWLTTKEKCVYHSNYIFQESEKPEITIYV